MGVCENSAGVREAVGRDGLSIPSGLGSLPVITRVGASSNPLGFLDLDELFVLSFSGKGEPSSLGSRDKFSGSSIGWEATESTSVSMSGLELGGGEGVLGGSFKGGGAAGMGGVGVKLATMLDMEAGASREGSFGETSVSNAWIVSLEDEEIVGSVEMVTAIGSVGGFLEGVTNLMTDGVGS